MNIVTRTSLAAFAGIGALAWASSASACGDGLVVHQAAYQGSGLSGLFHQASDTSPGDQRIVGMWSFTMTASGYSDFGYQQWHSDGTEFMNSGGRPPAIQNYCMGVWHQTGPSRFHLNHFALSYDPSGTLNAKINIKEDVTLDKNAANYSGNFEIDVYPVGGPMQKITGQVSAQRVPAN